MKVQSLIRDLIINSRINYNMNDAKESIVWFNKNTLKPYIETQKVILSDKVHAAHDLKRMTDGRTFEVYQTPYATLQVLKDQNGGIKKMAMKDYQSKSKISVNEYVIDGFKAALKYVDNDLFKNI